MILAGLALTAVAGGGLFVSMLALANLPGDWPPAVPRTRLTGWLLLAAVLLFVGTGWAGARFFLEESGEPPGLALQVALTVAGVLLASIFLAIAAGLPRAVGQPPRWTWTVGAYLGALPGFFGLAWLNAWLMGFFRDTPPVSDQAVVAGMETLGGLELAWVFVAGALLQPVLEEYIFRGWLWRYFAARDDFGPARGLVFTTVVFTLAHDPSVYLPVAYLGLFFGWVCWRTGSVGHAVLAHLLHNGATSLLVILLRT